MSELADYYSTKREYFSTSPESLGGYTECEVSIFSCITRRAPIGYCLGFLKYSAFSGVRLSLYAINLCRKRLSIFQVEASAFT